MCNRLFFNPFQIYGTNFFTFSSSSDTFGPWISWTIFPSRARITFGLVVLHSNAGFLSSSSFSASTRMISTLFSNSSMTALCKFL
jgi:hypothetical protein